MTFPRGLIDCAQLGSKQKALGRLLRRGSPHYLRCLFNAKVDRALRQASLDFGQISS
jgi:hypothetical protein